MRTQNFWKGLSMALNPLWPDMMDIKCNIFSNPSQKMPLYHGGGLPERPEDKKEYLLNSTVFAIQPEKTIVAGKKSNTDSTMGLWTFEGYDANSKVVNDENLIKPGRFKRHIEFTGMWKWEDTTEVPWYYDIYYETFDKTTGKSEWKLFKEASGGKKQLKCYTNVVTGVANKI